jgi:hypothetical protein
MGHQRAMALELTGFAAALLWMFVGWGALKSVHTLTRARSAAALFVAAVLWITVWIVTAVAAAVLAEQTAAR